MSIRIEPNFPGENPRQPARAEEAAEKATPVPAPMKDGVQVALSPASLEAAKNTTETGEARPDGDEIQSHEQAMSLIADLRGQMMQSPQKAIASYGGSQTEAVMQLLA